MGKKISQKQRKQAAKKRRLPPPQHQMQVVEVVQSPVAVPRAPPIAGSTAPHQLLPIGGLSGDCHTLNNNNPNPINAAGNSARNQTFEEERVEEQQQVEEEIHINGVNYDGYQFNFDEGISEVQDPRSIQQLQLIEVILVQDESEDHHMLDEFLLPRNDEREDGQDANGDGNRPDDNGDHDDDQEHPQRRGRRRRDNIHFKRFNAIMRKILKILTGRHLTQFCKKNYTNKCFFVGCLIYLDNAHQIDNVEQLFDEELRKLRRKLMIERQNGANEIHLLDIEALIPVYIRAVKEFIISRNPTQALNTVYLRNQSNRKRNDKGYNTGLARIQDLRRNINNEN